MVKTKIVLPDGTSILSGNVQKTSIVSSVITQKVNSGNELTLGSVCAAMAEIKILLRQTGTLISAGDEITVYKVEEGGTQRKIGLFTCDKPTLHGRTLSVTAYDRVTWLDKDITKWLSGLTGWPYSLFTLAQMVCGQCGLTLKNKSIPNGDYQVQKFLANGITGRDVIQWAAQAAGRFCVADPDGNLEMKWYTPAGRKIGPSEIAGEQIPYFMGSFQREDYAVKPVEKVQIQFSDSDVGIIYPDAPGEKNTYKVIGNYLLTAQTPETLLPIAKTLYNQLKDVTYVPCKVSIPASIHVNAGSTVNIKDADGKMVTTYVMQKKQAGNRDALECTGSMDRSTTSVVNNRQFNNLIGKILDLKTDVDGVDIKVTEVSGRLTTVSRTATEAKSAAASAITKAGAAESTANTAKKTADSASGIANTAKSTADKAKSTADTAKSTADTAKGTADTANSKVDNLSDVTNTQLTQINSSIAGLNLRADGITASVESNQKLVDDRFSETNIELQSLRQSVSAQITSKDVKFQIESERKEAEHSLKDRTGITLDENGVTVNKSNSTMKTTMSDHGLSVQDSGKEVLQADNTGVYATNLRATTYLIVGGKLRIQNIGSDRAGCFWIGG